MDIDLDHLQIKRIRYVMDWGLKVAPEEGFIIEFGSRRELLGRSELGLSVAEFKASIAEQNHNSLLFGKDLVTNQAWYEYPIVYGVLDDDFDEASDYEADGKYAGNDYTNFKTKYA